MIIGVGIFKQKNRHKGEYLTREDEGAHDAFDADTAVLQVLFFSVKSQRSFLDSMIFTNFLPFFCRVMGNCMAYNPMNNHWDSHSELIDMREEASSVTGKFR